MCGPLVALMGVKLRKDRGDGRAGAAAPAFASMLVYHGARIVAYAALGAIVGAAGSLVGAASGVTAVAAAVSLMLGVAIIVLGLGYVGLLPPVLQKRGGLWWDRAASWALRRPGESGVALLGGLNGLLPCGLVYGALLVAAGTGGAAWGALSMAVFGLATLPALVIIQTGAGALLGPRRRLWLVRAAGVLVLLIGVQLCLRGLATLGLVPSAQIGSLMLW